MDRMVAVFDVFDLVSTPNPPLYVMPASQAYRTWRSEVPFPSFVAAHLAVGPPPPPIMTNVTRANNNSSSNNRAMATKSNVGNVNVKEGHSVRNGRRRREKYSMMNGDTVMRLSQMENRKKKNAETFAEMATVPTQIERYPADPSGGASLVITKTKGRVICRLEYSREFIMQCSMSPWTKLCPEQMPYIVQNFSEILPPGPQTFSPNEYKVNFAKLKKSNS